MMRETSYLKINIILTVKIKKINILIKQDFRINIISINHEILRNNVLNIAINGNWTITFTELFKNQDIY